MTERLLRIAERIADELDELQRMVQRVQEGWRRAQESADDLYLDAVALNLHSFYSGLERLFELIATSIDGSLPQGANWHTVLLERVAMEISGVRPAVISGTTRDALGAYRGFRHVVRHVYAFRFDAAKMQYLVEEMSAVFTQAQSELLAFADFLKQTTDSSY